nr:hypothetical protein GCM10020093_007510 [Planobispora longispora]
MTPRPSLGLRTRLLFAFALLCVVTAAAVAGGMYVQARNDILQRTQDAAAQAMTSRLQTLYPLRNPAPGPEELGRIARTVSDGNISAVALYQETHSLAARRRGLPPPRAPARRRAPAAGRGRAALDPGAIPPELRRAVAAATSPGSAWCGEAHPS